MSLPPAVMASGLFSDADEATRSAAAGLFRAQHLPAGATLTSPAEPASPFVVITAGAVTVEREMAGRVHEVARLGPGAFVGELSLLHGTRPTATVRAIDDVDLLVVPPEQANLLLEVPGVRERLERTARRRMATNRLDHASPIVVDLAGRPVEVRPLWPDDWRLMVDGAHRTSPTSLQQRFFSAPKIHEGFLRRLTGIDYREQFAWAATDADGLAAVGRYGRLREDRDTAELALLVADDLHGNGLGSLLTTALAAAAHEHGITWLSAVALATNDTVQHLLARFGAVWERGDRGAEVEARWPVDEALRLAPPQHPVEDFARTAAVVLGDGDHDDHDGAESTG